MKTFVRAFAVVSVACLVAGCHRITYQYDRGVGPTVVDTRWQQYFVLGLVPVETRIEIETLCSSNPVVQLKSYTSPANAIAGVVSAGMSAGRTVEVVCLRRKDAKHDAGAASKDDNDGEVSNGAPNEERRSNEEDDSGTKRKSLRELLWPS